MCLTQSQQTTLFMSIKMRNNTLPGIEIVSVTNRGKAYLKNIVKNFLRQKYPAKYLHVILNSDKITPEEAVFIIEALGVPPFQVRVSQVLNQPLGACLNTSIDILHPTCYLWAKFDDDDFYGEEYLREKIRIMIEKNVDIVGQIQMICYVPELDEYFFRSDGTASGFSSWVRGASIICNRTVFNKVRFCHTPRGCDTVFLKDAHARKLKIYAGPPHHFICVRHTDVSHHTWQEPFDTFRKKTRKMDKNRIAQILPGLQEFAEHVFME